MRGKLIFIRVIFSLLFCFFFSGLNAEDELPFPDPEILISMDYKDAKIKDVLKIFSIQSGLNFIASETLQDRQITLYLDKVPVKEAMDKIFKANNLSYELDEEANIIIVKDWGAPQLETITRVYFIKNRSVPSGKLETEKQSLLGASSAGSTGSTASAAAGGNLLTSIEQVLSKDGKVVADVSTNSLIITDVPSRFSAIERIIKQLDIPQLQVMLDVEMLDVNKKIVDTLGFEFGDNPLTLMLPGSFVRRGAQFYIGAKADKNKEGGITLGGKFAHVLDFLRSQTDTKYLARPRLLTLNNETAEISITKDEVVGKKETTTTPTTGGSTTAVEYIRSTDLSLTGEGVGIFLRVTPQINPDTNEVTMVIHPKTSITTTSTLASSQADAEVRSTKSIVKVHDGETVVVGGLIHVDKQVSVKKIPFLGDIPFLGMLFRNKDVTKNLERELLVFITPHIIKEKSSGYAQASQATKVAFPVREQNTGTVLDRRATINTSLNRFERIK